MCAYLHIKFQVSSIILTSFRQEGRILQPPPPTILQNEPLKSQPSWVKIDEKSYKNIFIYNIEYVTIKHSKYVKINSVNPLHLVFSKVNGYLKEINGNKYLMLLPNNESKEKIKII